MGYFCTPKDACFTLWLAPNMLTRQKTESLDLDIFGEPKQVEPRNLGLLTVVGLGIRPAEQLTFEVQSALREAELIICMTDPESSLDRGAFQGFIKAINPIASIEDFEEGISNPGTREGVVGRLKNLVELAKDGKSVCVATYGHPGVFYPATHELIRLGEEAGVPSLMLPAISSLDCLYADMRIDPVSHGLSVFDAEYFGSTERVVDTSVCLALMQPNRLAKSDPLNWENLGSKLKDAFGEDHQCYLYQASSSGKGGKAKVISWKLSEWLQQTIEPGFILFVPHKKEFQGYTDIESGILIVPPKDEPETDQGDAGRDINAGGA